MIRLKAESVHKDSRRTFTQLFTANIKQVNCTEANHGAILGNHFHKDTIEYFYITRGVLLYNNKEIIRRGDMFVIKPTERHTLKVMSDKATFLTFLTEPYNHDNPDLHK